MFVKEPPEEAAAAAAEDGVGGGIRHWLEGWRRHSGGPDKTGRSCE